LAVVNIYANHICRCDKVMSNFEARIRTYQPNLFLDFTKEHPDTKISYWMTDISFVVVFESNNSRDIEDADGIGFCCPPLHRSKQCCQLEVVFRIDHTNQDNINEIITSSGAWYLQPVVIEKGWEYFMVYSVSRGSIESIVKRLRETGGDAELLSIREVSIRDISNNALLPASTLYQDFTARQLELLALAYKEGYFDQPARITADRLAEKVGLSRSTLAEHLRKAEDKLLKNALPAMLVSMK
jgi:predicted DNA binding protein